MKKLSMVIAVLWSFSVFAEVPNAIKIEQITDSAGSSIRREISPPPADGILGYDYFTNRPIWALVSAVPVSSAQISDSTSAGRTMLTAPSIAYMQSMLAVPTKTSDVINDSGFVTATVMNAAMATKMAVPSGTSSQVVLGNGTLGSVPAHTQSADTITDGTTNKAFLAAERTKLSGISTGATANDTDANLKSRASHTGTQASSTISDFNSAADARVTLGIAGKENTITAGTTSQYWRGDKTWQATPVPQIIQRARVQTDASGNYTWTYPAAYGSGVVPVISALSESASTTVPQGVQIVGVPTNTSATFKVINLPSTSVLSIVVLGAPTAAQAYIHLTATAP